MTDRHFEQRREAVRWTARGGVEHLSAWEEYPAAVHPVSASGASTQGDPGGRAWPVENRDYLPRSCHRGKLESFSEKDKSKKVFIST